VTSNGKAGNGSSETGPGARIDSMGRPLPKRFYKDAKAAEKDGQWRLELDGRPARTPGKRELLVPSRALAEAVAGEWQAQATHIDPGTMPLTRLVNTALDGVTGREAEVAADIVKYSLSDLLCYRADRPDPLVARQVAAWEPVLVWAEARFGASFIRQTGLMPVTQPPAVATAMADALAGLDRFRLAALHVMTTLMGSALLALAVHERRLSMEEAWAAAHVDDDWQIQEWGEDAEARARRDKRRVDMQAAAQVLSLLEKIVS